MTDYTMIIAIILGSIIFLFVGMVIVLTVLHKVRYFDRQLGEKRVFKFGPAGHLEVVYDVNRRGEPELAISHGYSDRGGQMMWQCWPDTPEGHRSAYETLVSADRGWAEDVLLELYETDDLSNLVRRKQPQLKVVS